MGSIPAGRTVTAPNDKGLQTRIEVMQLFHKQSSRFDSGLPDLPKRTGEFLSKLL